MKKGWEIKNLADVCEFFNDGNWIESKDQSESGYRLIQTGNVGIGEFRNKSGKERYVSEETFKRLKCTEIFEGDILVSRLPDPVGRTCVLPTINLKMITAVDCTIIRLNKKILLTDFFKYYSQSQSYFNSIAEKISGTTRDRISRSNLGKIKITVPPIAEQELIVTTLDEAFAAIDQAEKNVQRNLQNAKNLFQSELNSIFENKGVNWLEKSLKEIGETQTGNTPPTKEPDNYGDFIPFVKPPHFKVDGTIDSEESGLSEKGLKSARLFKANSILMVCIGATIGKTGFSEISLTSNQQINALTPREEFEPRFFYYALITDTFFKKVIHGSSQATLPIINKGKWENLTVTFPKNKKEQKKIVNQLDTLSIETKNLENIYQQKLNALEELKKSILQKAFSGELTKKKYIQIPARWKINL